MSKWPKGRNLVVSSQTDLSIFPENQKSDLQKSDLDGHKVIKADFSSSKTTIAGLPAIDFLGDGSLFLLDSPGHLQGHMTAIVRTTPTSFIVLGADSFHHVGAIRPNGEFQANIPCPRDLLEFAKNGISTDFFWSTNTQPGRFDLPSRTQPFFSLSDTADSFFVDPRKGQLTADRLAVLDGDKDFLTLITHDLSIASGALPLATSLENWQKDGLKEKLAWLFVDQKNPAFLFSPAESQSSLDREYADCVQTCAANRRSVGPKEKTERSIGMDWDTLF
ncbi:Metallo-beta-lactamase superfamily protein [Mycena indigotica]|uniref:Metallo-beta-lactamase superfamily protein n=1 Tax=Mycena indigotica TaxID=2126181 RepID=A0A8H6WBM6_9AGAR|nr:Metallo-beta-lactamase superfamily protein [Mycena indigotica]KAF7311972.1 Metallo-beta-lactamase superfamily protein [Mycena indigotica]